MKEDPNPSPGGVEDPGVFPYTRGIRPRGYAERPWTIRQYAGFGTARETNERYHALLRAGQTGFSVAFDLPTQMGYDPDHPLSHGEVGRAGVSICAQEDMAELFDGIALDRVSVSMTINATAAIVLAFYQSTAEDRGVPIAELRGTVQNDILKEFVARGCYLYPPEPSLRLATDVVEHCLRFLPRWNALSVSGYHIREAGATAAQEIGFTLAHASTYVEHARKRGLDPNAVGRTISFFFNAHSAFLEEIAKFRAARALWARILRERFGVTDERALQLRFHAQTAGSTLTAQQPMNNVVRVTLQALAAAFGGAQSIHTNSYDEALALPTERAATLAVRTQQILQNEMGLRDVVDPFGGSEFIERRTRELQEEALAIFREVEARGGALEAIRSGWTKSEIERSAIAYQREIESGRRGIVGVNRYVEDTPSPPIQRVDPALEEERKKDVQRVRRERSQAAWQKAIDDLRRARDGTENLMGAILQAVRARATLGEISACLAETWGTFRPGRTS